jgi:hypothetical protein
MLKGSIRRQDKAVLKVMSEFCNLHVVSLCHCKMNDGVGNLGDTDTHSSCGYPHLGVQLHTVCMASLTSDSRLGPPE